MNTDSKVLVVGTTPDYIDWIRHATPGRALFLTAPEIRQMAKEPSPHRAEEILCPLEDTARVIKELINHLYQWHLSVDGIACFDCESMELAATLAQELSLPYPTVESIRLCRDKYISKTIWQKNDVLCPRSRLIQSSDEAHAFLKELDAPCVLKPVTGSGSELIFQCSNRQECDNGAQFILDGLKARESNRLYSNATSWFLVEEYVCGDEYSCDFIINDNEIKIIRLTKKLPHPDSPFGTTMGYALLSYPSEEFSSAGLEDTLYRGAAALGLSKTICMVDFLHTPQGIMLLEMTPRPGGDCLPHLLRHACDLDILGLTLDYAQQRPHIFSAQKQHDSIGLRLHSRQQGVVTSINCDKLRNDERIQEINVIRQAGHIIHMPPEDYESWYLGHLIFQPAPGVNLQTQCYELRQQLVLEIA